MQSSMCLSGLALGGATLFATTAIAGGLPKEGAFSVDDETRGSYQRGAAPTPGDAGSWYESGKIVGDGILKGMAWRCLAMPEIIEGTLRSHTGYCVGTAQDGDQVTFRIVVGLASNPDEKSEVSAYSTEGSGKYRGIVARYTATCILSGPKTGYTKNCNGQGAYKLP